MHYLYEQKSILPTPVSFPVGKNAQFRRTFFSLTSPQFRHRCCHFVALFLSSTSLFFLSFQRCLDQKCRVDRTIKTTHNQTRFVDDTVTSNPSPHSLPTNTFTSTPLHLPTHTPTHTHTYTHTGETRTLLSRHIRNKRSSLSLSLSSISTINNNHCKQSSGSHLQTFSFSCLPPFLSHSQKKKVTKKPPVPTRPHHTSYKHLNHHG